MGLPHSEVFIFTSFLKMANMAKPLKAKRNQLSLETKIIILKEVDAGKKKSDIAKSYNLPSSTLSTIIKQRDKFYQEEAFNISGSEKRKRMRTAHFVDLEDSLITWLKEARAQNIPINGPILKQKAESLASLLDDKNFKASNGWIERFKIRHGLVFRNVCGEAASVSPETVTEWQSKLLPALLEGYETKNIFNADETGLFFKLLPDKTLTYKGDDCHGGKKSKERITVMLMCNMDGSEKIKPLVIGKSKNPRCFKGIKSLPVDYESNKKAWMTGDLFVKWLVSFDKKMKAQKRKVLLIIDNCASHNHVPKLAAVSVKFLPPNTTSNLQPLDQGIIQNVKCMYRRRLVDKVLINIENKKETLINIKDAIDMLSAAWNNVTQKTISNCFRKAGFVCNDNVEGEEEVTSEETNNNDNHNWQALLREIHLPEDLQFEDFIQVDENLQIAPVLTDAEIVAAVKEKNDTKQQEEEELENDEGDVEPTTRIKTVSDASLWIEDLRIYLQSQHELPDKIIVNLDEINDYIRQKAVANRQQKITDFFSSN